MKKLCAVVLVLIHIFISTNSIATSYTIESGTLTGISDELLDNATDNITYDGPIDELLLWVLYDFRGSPDYIDAYFGVDENKGDMTAIVAIESLKSASAQEWADRIMRKFSSSLSVYSSTYSSPSYSSLGSFFDSFDAHIFLIDKHYNLLSLITWDCIQQKSYESDISGETWNELALETWGVNLDDPVRPSDRPRISYVPTPTPFLSETVKYSKYRDLKPGDSGDDVKDLKQRLYELGYFDSDSFNDFYGAPLSERVKAFQEKNNLDPTGIASAEMQELCFSENASPLKAQSRQAPSLSNLSAVAESNEYDELRRGDKGKEVLSMKERLYELGYYNTNKLNNSYSDSTVEAVKRFQEANNLEQTGIASPLTLSVLYSQNAKGKPTPTPKPTRKPTPTPRPTKIPYKKIAYKDLARDIDGYKGAYVKFNGAKVLQFFDSDISKYDAYALIYVDRYAEQLMYIYIPGFKSWGWTDGSKVSRLLEDDKIDIHAKVVGSYTYTTIMGDERTVPYLSVDDMWLYD